MNRTPNIERVHGFAEIAHRDEFGQVISYSATKADPMRTGNAHPQINPYDIPKCKNGFVALSIGSDYQWVKFCDAFNRPEWKTDEKYVVPVTLEKYGVAVTMGIMAGLTVRRVKQATAVGISNRSRAQTKFPQIFGENLRGFVFFFMLESATIRDAGIGFFPFLK